MRCSWFVIAGLVVAVVAGCGVSGPALSDDDDDGQSSSDAVTSSGAGAGMQQTTASGGAGGQPPSTGGGDVGGQAPVPDLQCVQEGAQAALYNASQQLIANYDDLAQCQQALDHKGEGVVCVWFTPGMQIGPGAWDETGWRAMNIETQTGLGRRPHLSLQDCLDATQNARGGVVCTNTGVGYKSAHIVTNQWCGASSNLPYCLQASLAARDYFVCSFPSDGDGSGPGWVLTEIADTTCDYLTSSMPLGDCNAQIP